MALGARELSRAFQKRALRILESSQRFPNHLEIPSYSKSKETKLFATNKKLILVDRDRRRKLW